VIEVSKLKAEIAQLKMDLYVSKNQIIEHEETIKKLTDINSELLLGFSEQAIKLGESYIDRNS
jgi:hypothetical protein